MQFIVRPAAAALVFKLTAIVAIVLNYVTREEVAATALESHT